MCICCWKTIIEIVKDVSTVAGILGAGFWALYLYRRQREDQPRVEMRAEIVFHKKIGNWWIVELIAYIENKGKVQHKLYDLEFDLASIETGDPVNIAQQFGNQAHFPHTIAKGSFKREDMEYFFIEPGVKGKYSYLTRVPVAAEVILLHAWFAYENIHLAHGAEITVSVPID